MKRIDFIKNVGFLGGLLFLPKLLISKKKEDLTMLKNEQWGKGFKDGCEFVGRHISRTPGWIRRFFKKYRQLEVYNFEVFNEKENFPILYISKDWYKKKPLGDVRLRLIKEKKSYHFCTAVSRINLDGYYHLQYAEPAANIAVLRRIYIRKGNYIYVKKESSFALTYWGMKLWKWQECPKRKGG